LTQIKSADPKFSMNSTNQQLKRSPHMADIIARLVRECNAERAKRTDFPTIWTTMLKSHPYVAGLPIQESVETGPRLKIPLLTGRFLVFDGSTFSVA